MAVVAGLIRARRNKTGPALPAARALPARVVADLLCAARRTPAARRDRDAATYPDVARTRAATRLGGDLLLAQPDPGASTARCCVRMGPPSRER